MKSLKKKWIDQLDKTVPALDENIKNMPIDVAVQAEYNGSNTLARTRKVTIVTVLSVLAVLLLGAAIVCGVMLSPKPQADGFAFTVEINPSATIVTDKNGNVTAIISSNADADVILADSAALSTVIGKPIDEAIAWYTDRAAMLGYLNPDNNAVRISACEKGEELLTAAKDALEKYFIGKGNFSVVVCQTVSLDEFKNRSGLEISSLSSVFSLAESAQTLFASRKTSSADKDKLQSIYKELVLTDDLISAIQDFLSANLQRIEQNATDLKTIGKLCFEIIGHPENPAAILKDYWSVKTHYDGEYSGEFAELMSQMDVALARYKDSYGVTIESTVQLEAALNKYLTTSVDAITAIINNFSKDLLVRYSDLLSGVLDVIGMGDNELVELFSAPSTVTEFNEKLSAALGIDFDRRKTANEDLYNGGEEISKQEYDSFIADILSQYGSLSNYWEQK